ncbi:MAG TPA: T9SS type A sorting domain-containing protein, partial [Bacteroidia bacterium]
IAFVDPTTLQGANNFPTANLGIILSGQGQAFGVSSASSVQLIGQGVVVQGYPVLLKINPAEKLFEFPSTFGTSWTSHSVAKSNGIPFTQQAGVDSVRITITTDKDITVDAWGSLTTPLGTHNVLRQKEHAITTQQVEVHTTGPFPPAGWYPYPAFDQTDSTLKYNFLANGVGFPVMEIDTNLVDGNVDVTWLIETPQVGLNEFTKTTDPRVFPNPAGDNLFIGLDKNTDAIIEVYDLQGKMVLQTEAKGVVAQLNVSKLEKGIYVYKVKAKDGSFAAQGKFVISR